MYTINKNIYKSSKYFEKFLQLFAHEVLCSLTTSVKHKKIIFIIILYRKSNTL